MKKNFILFCSVSIVFFLITCTKAKGPLPQKTATTSTAAANVCDSAYWTNGAIQPLIIASCATNSGCHGAGGSAVDYTTYAGVKSDVDNGTFKDRVFVVKDMPKAPGTPLSASQLELINCWLSKGAPNAKPAAGAITTTTTPTPTVAVNSCTSTISYSLTISPIISTYCAAAGCHDTGSPDGDYTNFAGVKIDADNGKMNVKVVILKSMPKFPFLPLSDDDIKSIDCWIQQGAKNN